MSRRCLIVLSAISGLWIAGCQQSKKPLAGKSPVVPTAQKQGDSKSKIDQMDANADNSIDALTRKAEAYAREIAPLVEAHNANRQALNSSTTKKSEVTWLDPSDFRLGGPDAIPSSASNRSVTIKTVINGGPASANQAAQTPAADRPARPVELATAEIANLLPGASDVTTSNAWSSDSLSQRLSKRVKEYPRDVSAQLEFQLLEFLRDQPTPQLAAMSAMPTEDREVVTTVLDGLANFRNAVRADNNMLLSGKIKPLLDMSERLRSQADLMIPTIALCKKVDTYATYEPIEPARFAATQDHKVIVYCEVANFTSNLNEKKLWETRLSTDITIFTEQGMQVWSAATETIVDSARTRRRDFFVVKMITLPKTLTIGRYLLKASLVDTQSNRVAEATTALVIAAQ